MQRIVEPALFCYRRFWRRTAGAAAVEFAILCTALVLLIGGIIDFGQAFYIKQVVTNASREGARYGVPFQVDATATRIPPSASAITNYVINNYLSGTVVSGLNPTVTVTGNGLAAGAKGQPVQVQVTASTNWLLLGKFIPGLPTTISATTVMLCE